MGNGVAWLCGRMGNLPRLLIDIYGVLSRSEEDVFGDWNLQDAHSQ